VKKLKIVQGGRLVSLLTESMKKFGRIVIGAAFLLLLLLQVPAAAWADQLVDRIVATVDGDPITMQDLKKFAAATKTPMPTDDSPQSQEIQKKALGELISQKLVDHEVSTVEVEDEQVDRFIAQFEAGNHITDAQLRDQLAQHGISYDAYRQRARQEVQKMTMIQREVHDKVVITHDQIEAYYKSHISDFTVSEERFKLAQILVAVDPTSAPPALVQAARAKAEGLRKKAVKGADFAALATQFSDDDSKTQGGELGYFKPDEINDQILAAIAKLKAGDISAVVHTDHGFHIVKVEEHQEAGVKPLGEVSEAIRAKLSQRQLEAQFRIWVSKELIKNHSVHTYL
jgi:peptidyl-prolyl cis-trans isomerase SurA